MNDAHNNFTYIMSNFDRFYANLLFQSKHHVIIEKNQISIPLY